MMKKRIERLEAKQGGRNEPTLIAFVPHHWDDKDKRTEVDRLARQEGISKPYDTMVIETGETRARIGFVENFDQLLNDIGKNSPRIGMRPS